MNNKEHQTGAETMTSRQTINFHQSQTKCVRCGELADGPSFVTPYDATNKYRGGRRTRWCAECWAQNVAECEASRQRALESTRKAMETALRAAGYEDADIAKALENSK